MKTILSPITYGMIQGVIRWIVGLAFMLPLVKRRRFSLRILLTLPIAVFIEVFLAVIPGMELMEVIVPVVNLTFYFLMGIFLIEDSISKIFYFSVWGSFGRTILYEIDQFLVYYFCSGFFAQGGTKWQFILGWCIMMMLLLGAIALFSKYWMIAYRMHHIGPRQTVSAILIYMVFEALEMSLYDNLVFGPKGYDGFGVLIYQMICIAVCYLQSALFRNSALRQELDTMHLLWNQQHIQYEKSKENIAVINQKCHDLKHQIAAMRTMESSEEREKYIKEIQDSVNFYEAAVKTGNETLDTVLTEKSLLCHSRGIEIHCVADGKMIDFMNPVDIYTLMGNALDNAIEAVSELKDEGLRIIDVLVYVRNQLIIITVVNPMKGTPEFKDGIPQTTKDNRDYHGFGVFSMRSTVHKYGGEISLNAGDGLFEVKILIPLGEKK